MQDAYVIVTFSKLQVAVALRWVHDELLLYEEFISLYDVANIKVASLYGVIRDNLLQLTLPLTKIRGQCYDGVSNMSRIRNGVAKRIQDQKLRAVFTHCYGHALSLTAKDTIRRNTIMKRQHTKSQSW